jgi:hypothetical protein
MFQSSLVYAGRGALLGLAVLLAGTPLLLLRRFYGGGSAPEDRPQKTPEHLHSKMEQKL